MEEINDNLTKRQRRTLEKKQKIEHKRSQEKKQKMYRILFFIAMTLLFGGIVWGATQLSGDGANVTVDAVSANDHVTGNTSAAVILIEYSDFQCPACKSLYTILNEVKDEFTETVQIAFRHFPLRSIHGNAWIAAEAAEAAGQQGKFWEMHDELFDNQGDWSEAGEPIEKFVSYAEELGLDVDQFRADIESDVVRNKVTDDYNSGESANVSGTPSYFLNGKKVDNPRDADGFRSMLQEAVNESVGVSVEVDGADNTAGEVEENDTKEDEVAEESADESVSDEAAEEAGETVAE